MLWELGLGLENADKAFFMIHKWKMSSILYTCTHMYMYVFMCVIIMCVCASYTRTYMYYLYVCMYVRICPLDLMVITSIWRDRSSSGFVYTIHVCVCTYVHLYHSMHKPVVYGVHTRGFRFDKPLWLRRQPYRQHIRLTATEPQSPTYQQTDSHMATKSSLVELGLTPRLSKSKNSSSTSSMQSCAISSDVE